MLTFETATKICTKHEEEKNRIDSFLQVLVACTLWKS